MEKIEHPFPLSFKLSNPWRFPILGMPLRCSIPLPQGLVNNPSSELILLDEKDHDCHAQWRVLSRWNDGSVRFALMNYAEEIIAPRKTYNYVLTLQSLAGKIKRGEKKISIKVKENPANITINTGRLVWTFNKKKFTFADSIKFNGRDLMEGQKADLCITDEMGFVYRASEGSYRIFLEENGPYRVVVRIEGNHGHGRKRFMDYILRFHFTAGGSQVLMLHHIRNRHDGIRGVRFQRCWMEGAINVNHTAVRRILHNARSLFTMHAPLECPERVDLDTDIWPVEIKADRYRFPKTEKEIAWKGPLTLIRNGDSLREKEEDICPSIYEKNPGKNIAGDRRSCAPLIDIHEPGFGGMLFKFAMVNPEAEFPLHLGSERNMFEIDFFPSGEEMFHFSEGMGKTRDVLLNFHDDSLDPLDLFHESNNLSYPGVVSPGAKAYRCSKFADMDKTLVPQRNKYMLLEEKIDFLRMAQHGLLWPLALGWEDYGDEYGARGNLQNKNVWQFINNEEDYLWCCMIEAWRRGEAFDGLAIARHVMDIDYIDHSADPRRNGATCPHSEDHTNGEVYTSHQWCQGLLYFYLATGDEEVLRICKRIGDCLVWWITGPMKYALRGSGRETAWPLLSLSALYEVTHEKRYAKAALMVVDDLIKIQKEHGSVVWEYPLGSGIFSDYMLTMTFNGIWDTWKATGEERVLKLWKDITKPVIDKLENPDNWGYVIFRNWPIKVADLTVLAHWYELTGDKKYIELGRNGLRLILAAAPQLDNQFQGFFAMWYRHIIYFLKYADEAGMINDDLVTLVW